MTKTYLNDEKALLPFLNPSSVAVIGVSPNWSYVNTVFKQFVAFNSPAHFYPINPRYQEVEGVQCYPRLTDVPGEVELAIVSVRAELVPDALEQCEQKKVKAINIITSGFAEIGGEEGARRHKLMTDYVERTGIRIIGPNCFGNASAIYKFTGMPNTAQMCSRPGKLSLAFQSGGLALTMVFNCFDRYVDIAHVLCTGNEVDLDIADCVNYFAHDEHTAVIGLYVEQFRKPDLFLQAAEICAANRKPIVVMKSGRSEQGAKMAQAHTGALAGSDKIIDAVLKKYGITRVYDLNEMLETMAIMHSKKLPKGRGVGAITNSGGENSLIVDLAEDIGIEFPPVSPESAAIIRQELYDYISVSNPLDITGPGGLTDQHVHQAALAGMGSDPNLHIILHQLGGNSKFDAQSPGGKMLFEAIAKYPEKIWLRTSKMAGSFTPTPIGIVELIEPRHEIEGVPVLMGLDNILKAVSHLIEYGEFQAQRNQNQTQPRTILPEIAEKAKIIIRAAKGQPLTENQSKQILSLYQIPVTREVLVNTAEDAAKAASEIGFPLVMKIVSPQILHKTEAGGVVLNLQSAAEARAAFERIMQNARNYNPSADLQGVLVQEMVSGGTEMIVGMTRDPQFGAGIIVGLGGIFVEALKDISLALPPLNHDTARHMLEQLKGKAILKGVRGQPPADLNSLITVLLNFSQLCQDLQGEVSEIDINPLLVLEEGKGVRALDCLIVP
jgi:acetate---CoA ligase (ADP-forming)